MKRNISMESLRKLRREEGTGIRAKLIQIQVVVHIFTNDKELMTGSTRTSI